MKEFFDRETAVPRSDSFPRHRLDALVDAVLAITMTLLVLELRLPEDIHGDLVAALSGLTPKIISWIVSFLILAVCWHSHVVNFRHVEHIDTRLFWLVTLWLLITSVLPFTSSLIGEHNGLPLSHILYAANIVAIQAAALLRNWHLRRHPALFRDGSAEGHEIGWVRAIAITIAAAGSIVLGYHRPDYASLAYLAIGPVAALLKRLQGGRGRKGREPA